ncbi:unnamed protein product [Calicophoron daubneyi]|uniref:P-type phospholipid transporter n=1 Tax=Calicophoron daubneyi TaxID=300641 RepID=A0AAV2T5R5_CALDB
MGNCFRRTAEQQSSRIIYPSTVWLKNEDGYYLNPNNQYAGNKIRTTKYRIWNFLFLNLWEQFHRFANVYFLCIVILNFMPEIDAFAKEVAPIPVVLTLAIVAIKDAYEDFRRHLSDKKVNRKICEVYCIDTGCYGNRQWQTIVPGDFVRLHTNEVIPADVLLLHSSNVAGICHIETANLDGESNLKQREVVERRLTKEAFSPSAFTSPVEVEAPNAELYKFTGRINRNDGLVAIRKNNVILRGCVLRNTDYIEGLVIYAGRETKAALNNTGPRFKRSQLERQINMDVIWCVLILAVICLTGAIGCGIWQQNFPGDDVLFVALDRNTTTSTPVFQGFLNFWRFIIIFQSMIPLPLYVSIEFIKMHQVWHMNHDLKLYDPAVDKRIEVRAFNILEDLGQIEYVFCDKTGTLTENKMVFKQASIGGVKYAVDAVSDKRISDSTKLSLVDSSEPSEASFSPSPSDMNSLKRVIDKMSLISPNGRTQSSQEYLDDSNNQAPVEYIENFVLALAICNTAVVSATKNAPSMFQVPERRKGFRIISSKKPKQHHHRKSKADERSAPGRRLLFGRKRRHPKTETTQELVVAGAQNECTEPREAELSLEIPSPSLDASINEAEEPHPMEFGGRCRSSLSVPRILVEEETSSREEEFLDRKPQALSGRSLPPVVHGLELELPTPRGLFLPGDLSVRTAPPTTAIQPTSSYQNLGEVMSDENPDVGSCPSRIVQTTMQHQSSEVETIAHELHRSNLSNILTVVAHDGRSYELPVCEGFEVGPRDSTTCPLSDSTLYNSYESESPDELTLVRVACQQGCKLLQRGVDFVLLWLPADGLVCVKVLRILPFDSVRKRMSILVRHPCTNEAILYTKGADSSIFCRVTCSNDQEADLLDTIRRHVDEFSRAGLRTLVVTKKVISEEELKSWSDEMDIVESNPNEQGEELQALMDRMEQNLTLLGATGIEDRLQEGVPSTIQHLREAGIRVWVLTGDKQETAVNVAHAASLLTDNQRLICINASSKLKTGSLISTHLHAVIFGEPLPSPDEIDEIVSDGIEEYSSTDSYEFRPREVEISGNYRENPRKHVVISSPPSSISNRRNTPRIRFRQSGRKLKRSVSENRANRYAGHQNRRRRRRPRDNHLQREIICQRLQHNSLPPDLALVIDGETLEFALDDENKENFLRLARFCSSVICCRSTPSQKAAVVKLVKDGLNARTLAIGDGANDVHMIQVANVGVGIGGKEGMQAVMASDFGITQFRFLERLLIVHGHSCYDKLAHTALYLFYKDTVYILLLFWFQLFNGFSGSNAIDQISQVLFSITFTGLPPFVMGVWDNPIDFDTLQANPILYRTGIEGKAYRPWMFWVNILDAVWQSLFIFFIPYLYYADSTITMWHFGILEMNILILCALIHSGLETRSFVSVHWVGWCVSYFITWLAFTMIYHAATVVGIQPEGPCSVIFNSINNAPFWLLTLVTVVIALLPRLVFIGLKNTVAPSLDTIAGILSKKYGRGRRLPLEPFIFGAEISSIHLGASLLSRLRPSPLVSASQNLEVTGATDLTDGTPTSGGGVGEFRGGDTSANFLSRVGQLLTVTGGLIRRRSDTVGIRPVSGHISPSSSSGTRPSRHTVVDSRRHRHRSQTVRYRSSSHVRQPVRNVNNFDDQSGLPSAPVLWPAVDPNIRTQSLTSHWRRLRVRPSLSTSVYTPPVFTQSVASIGQSPPIACAPDGFQYPPNWLIGQSSSAPNPRPVYLLGQSNLSPDDPPPPYRAREDLDSDGNRCQTDATSSSAKRNRS